MIAHLAQAVGAPSPTLVLDARRLPADEHARLAALADARRLLARTGRSHVLKIALMEPSAHPLFDLDYRFVQALPEAPDRFDLAGSCGHSVLAMIAGAARSGLLAPLGTGSRTRVNVLNNGDHLVCETDEVVGDETRFTMHFLRPVPTPLSRLLLTAEPVTTLTVDGVAVPVSMVSAGNPYVFVAAASLGVTDTAGLFADDPALFERMARVRLAASAYLGRPAESVFPKIAAVLPVGGGQLAVRAISVPRWHPTLALTGAACLGAAARTAGTVPWLVAREAGCVDGALRIVTPGGTTAVTAAVQVRGGEPELTWTSVRDKWVRLQGSCALDAGPDPLLEDETRWLAT